MTDKDKTVGKTVGSKKRERPPCHVCGTRKPPISYVKYGFCAYAMPVCRRHR